MVEPKAYAAPNLVTPNRPVVFDPRVCTGCNWCVEVCQSDVFVPHPRKGEPPIILYPDECWYCGCCVKECPLHEKGAIQQNWPLMLRVRWKSKETGEHFRVGMPNPPPPNTRPPA